MVNLLYQLIIILRKLTGYEGVFYNRKFTKIRLRPGTPLGELTTAGEWNTPSPFNNPSTPSASRSPPHSDTVYYNVYKSAPMNWS